MRSLTKELQESYENAIFCYICKKIENKYLNDIVKLEIIVITQENIEVLRIAYAI